MNIFKELEINNYCLICKSEIIKSRFAHNRYLCKISSDKNKCHFAYNISFLSLSAGFRITFINIILLLNNVEYTIHLSSYHPDNISLAVFKNGGYFFKRKISEKDSLIIFKDDFSFVKRLIDLQYLS